MLQFRALASGSSGNAFLLRTEKVSLLFDAGLRFTTLRKYLALEGVGPAGLSAVFISHEHRDHCAAIPELVGDARTDVYANAAVLTALGLGGASSARVLDTGKSAVLGDVEVTSFPVDHDAVEPVGFLIRCGRRAIALATDLGRASMPVAEAVAEADLVVLESNHDPYMLHEGRYPLHLRRRVGGPTGHLSNTQAGTLLAQHARTGRGTEVWLAHLSKENNTVPLALRTVRSHLSAAGLGRIPVSIALRDRPSLRWNGAPRPQQLSLFGEEACL